MQHRKQKNILLTIAIFLNCIKFLKYIKLNYISSYLINRIYIMINCK